MSRPLSAEDALAEGFARCLVTLAEADGAEGETLSVLATAARAVSRATSAGHVCVDLGEILDNEDPRQEETRARLLGSGMVADVGSGTLLPLVLDRHNRLYLARYYDYEIRLATALTRRAAPLPQGDGLAADPVLLERLFAANRKRLGDKTDWQKLACALALRNRLTVIAGGPGTGKTTTVANLLAALLDRQPGLRVALAAPTGKAAQRMREALRARSAGLLPALNPGLPQEVYTLHRLLGVVPGTRQFRHHAGNLLPFDVLVVDEASMLDLALAARLLEAVPPDARLIFLGDKDQLAAVEAGAVFHEIGCDPSLGVDCKAFLAAATSTAGAGLHTPQPQRESALRDCVIWLDESLRYGPGSGIAGLATDIREGAAEAVIRRLRAGGDPSLALVADENTRLANSSVRSLLSGFDAYGEAVVGFRNDPAPVFAAFDRFRVLCALRGTERGVEQLNRLLSMAFRHHLRHAGDDGQGPWYPGLPLIVLRNDYSLGLFNGDIGLILPDEQGRLLAHFPTADGRHLPLLPARLPPHETAFALTVHKSQGSEFEKVALILPAQTSRVMTRELIYTSVTRARKAVTLYGSAEILAQAVQTPTVRRSGLIDRLRELACADSTRDDHGKINESIR